MHLTDFDDEERRKEREGAYLCLKIVQIYIYRCVMVYGKNFIGRKSSISTVSSSMP